MMRGAPTRFQQKQWQDEIGAGDKVALQVQGETVYSGEIVTNPTAEGYVKVRFDSPPSSNLPDVWNVEELKVTAQGHPQMKAAAAATSETEVTQAIQSADIPLEPGVKVKTKDRGNLGTVLTEPNTQNEVVVHFKNPTTKTTAQVHYYTDNLKVVGAKPADWKQPTVDQNRVLANNATRKPTTKLPPPTKTHPPIAPTTAAKLAKDLPLGK